MVQVSGVELEKLVYSLFLRGFQMTWGRLLHGWASVLLQGMDNMEWRARKRTRKLD